MENSTISYNYIKVQWTVKITKKSNQKNNQPESLRVFLQMSETYFLFRKFINSSFFLKMNPFVSL